MVYEGDILIMDKHKETVNTMCFTPKFRVELKFLDLPDAVQFTPTFVCIGFS